MKHEEYMKKAIILAKESKEKGGVPIGCLIVDKSGNIIAKGLSLTGPENDPTCHGEIMAIRQAAKAIGSNNLQGMSIYSTLESCGMCMSAALWANLGAIYFGSYASDVKGNSYEYRDYSSTARAEQSRRWDGTNILVQGGILRDDCTELMQNYREWQEVLG